MFNIIVLVFRVHLGSSPVPTAWFVTVHSGRVSFLAVTSVHVTTSHGRAGSISGGVVTTRTPVSGFTLI